MNAPASGLFGLVLVLSYFGVDLFRRGAERWSLLDVPNERSSHSLPIPVCGGVVVVLLNLAGWLWYGAGHHDLLGRHTLALAGAALVLAIVSLVDDLGHVPYRVRLTAHASAGLLAVGAFGGWTSIALPVVGQLSLGPAGTLIAVIWVVGLINSFNFMDGLDGLAAGQATAAAGGWVVLGIATGHRVIVVLGALLAATSIGFLLHNWHPAKIFMGDVGATFLGFGLAVLPIVAARYDPRFILAGVLLVWPVIFDSGFTVLRRLRHRENIFVGHRTFLFHRLSDAGWGHAHASILYTVLQLLGCLLALAWESGHDILDGVVAIWLVALCAGLWAFVRHQERPRAARDPLIVAPQEGGTRTTDASESPNAPGQSEPLAVKA